MQTVLHVGATKIAESIQCMFHMYIKINFKPTSVEVISVAPYKQCSEEWVTQNK